MVRKFLERTNVLKIIYSILTINVSSMLAQKPQNIWSLGSDKNNVLPSGGPKKFLPPHIQETKQKKKLELDKWMELEVKEEQYFKNSKLQTTLILLFIK